MDYPTEEQELAEHYHSDLVGGKSCRQRKVEFWLRFPRAFVRFQWFGLTQRALDGWRAVVNFGRRIAATRK